MSRWLRAGLRVATVVLGGLAAVWFYLDIRDAIFSVFASNDQGALRRGLAIAHLLTVAAIIVLGFLVVKIVYWHRPIDRALAMLGGYICGALAAAFALVVRGPVGPPGSGLIVFASDLVTTTLFLFGETIIVYGLVPWLILVFYAELKEIRSPVFYMVAGATIGMVAYAASPYVSAQTWGWIPPFGRILPIGVVGDADALTIVVPALLAGGIYWAIAGRNAGIRQLH